ncbi:transglycosylase domain-containing protein [Cutibacterium sp.]|uniref:transglycosylase domain-containing protein n=1 Tax=Cutibacterium sp. TaxID=1912221 RepID=UPI0026DC9E73|nr:transglycosylase domain-containing protein [Cutibacterium sp.]MDO4412376.1 transglycosylase domain-containing protein [Cutibacterium sp.]
MSELSRILKVMRSDRQGKLYSLAMFGIVSILAGLLAAGFVVPVAAVAGSTTKLVATSMEDLPAELMSASQAQKSQILMADGSVLATFYDENREYVPLSKISTQMQTAQVAIEDNRFFSHGAIDLKGTTRALVTNLAGSARQGGSTLTQQYVKQIRIEAAVAAGNEAGVQAAQEPTITRKVQELRYAVALEKKLSKKQILERYLNIAYYGDGAYGVEAAAHHYFGTTAANLDLAQSAMLAGIVQNPVAYNPVNHPEAAMNRRNIVLGRMAQLKLISTDEAREAEAVVFDKSKVAYPKNGCISSKYPFVCDYAYRSLLTMPSLGKNPSERAKMVKRGGLTIQTNIDPKAQDAAQKAVSEVVGPKDPVIAGTAIVQPGTGLIMAMAQSRPVMGQKPGETYYNYMAPASMGGATGFQAGSTFKAFTAAAALKKGIPINKRYDAEYRMDFTGETFTNCKGNFKSGPFPVKNSTSRSGVMDLSEAAAWSVNTYFVQLEQEVGMCDVTKMAQNTGVQLSNGKDIVSSFQNVPSFTLGTAYVSPLSMASAYATFASRGITCDPIILKSVKNRDGSALKVPTGNCKRILPQKVADGVNSVLSGVMDATGRAATIPGGYPQAGKTGTTDDGEAAWFDGYTPQAAGVAMIAADSGNSYFRGSDSRSIKGIQTSTGVYLNGSGGSDAGKIYRAAMAGVLKGKPKTDFVSPSDEISYGKLITIPNTDNMTYSEAKAAIEKAGFRTERWRVWDDSEPGTYLGSDPESKAHAGKTVALKVSKGPEPEPEPTYAPPTRQTQPKNSATAQPRQSPPAQQNQPRSNNGGGNRGGQQPPASTRPR